MPLSSLVPKGIYRRLRCVTLGDGVMCSGNHLEDVVSADSFLLSHFLNGIILNQSFSVCVGTDCRYRMKIIVGPVSRTPVSWLISQLLPTDMRITIH